MIPCFWILEKLVDRMHVDRRDYLCVVVASDAYLESHLLVDKSLDQFRIIDGCNAMSDPPGSE